MRSSSTVSMLQPTCIFRECSGKAAKIHSLGKEGGPFRNEWAQNEGSGRSYPIKLISADGSGAVKQGWRWRIWTRAGWCRKWIFSHSYPKSTRHRRIRSNKLSTWTFCIETAVIKRSKDPEVIFTSTLNQKNPKQLKLL